MESRHNNSEDSTLETTVLHSLYESQLSSAIMKINIAHLEHTERIFSLVWRPL